MKVFRLKNLKIIMLAVTVIACFMLLTGCGAASIEGTWVLTEEIEANGNKLNQKQYLIRSLYSSFRQINR